MVGVSGADVHDDSGTQMPFILGFHHPLAYQSPLLGKAHLLSYHFSLEMTHSSRAHIPTAQVATRLHQDSREFRSGLLDWAAAFW